MYTHMHSCYTHTKRSSSRVWATVNYNLLDFILKKKKVKCILLKKIQNPCKFRVLVMGSVSIP